MSAFMTSLLSLCMHSPYLYFISFLCLTVTSQILFAVSCQHVVRPFCPSFSLSVWWAAPSVCAVELMS